MRSLRLRSLVLAALLLLSACAAWFKPPTDPLKRLIVERDRLLTSADAVKPNQAMQMRQDAAKLQVLIDEARAGKPLDPAEVDRAIAAAKRRTY